MSDCYAELGVGRDATHEQIRMAFKKQALLWHPDLQPSEEDRAQATERFIRIREAYEVLRDSGARAAYDRVGSAREETADLPEEVINAIRRAQEVRQPPIARVISILSEATEYHEARKQIWYLKKRVEVAFNFAQEILGRRSGEKRNGKRVGPWETRSRLTEHLLTVVNYENDLPHGQATAWYGPGRKRFEAYFDHGKAEGKAIYFFPSGQIEMEMNYHQDENHGPFFMWYPNGQLKSFGRWEHGEKNGAWINWLPNGLIDREVTGFFYKGIMVKGISGLG